MIALTALAPGVVGTKSRTTVPVEDTQWRWVGKIVNSFGTASGVAIGPRTVLTARHVGEGTFWLGDQSFTVVNAVRPPDAPHPDGGSPSRVDLILINVDRDLPGWYRIADRVRAGARGIYVGYGGSGRVLGTGASYGIFAPAIGTRRAAPSPPLKGKLFVPGIGWTLYDELVTPGQGILVSGDSGGGYFVGGRLAGINSFNYNDSQVGSNPAVYPDFGFASANTAGYTDSAGTAIPAGRPYCGSGTVDLTRKEIRAWIATNSWRPPTP